MSKQREPLQVLRDHLYTIMYRRDWSMMHLSIECEISYETMRRVFTGETQKIYMSTIIKISEGIGVPVYALFDDREAV